MPCCICNCVHDPDRVGHWLAGLVDRVVQVQARRADVLERNRARRSERNRAVKDVSAHDGIDITGRPVEIDDLQSDT